MGVPSRTSAPTPVLIRTTWAFRSSSGRCAPSRHLAEGHPQVLIIAQHVIERSRHGSIITTAAGAKAGGGLVEAYPQDTLGKRTSGSFLDNGTRSLFEKAGFSYERSKGKNHCVMRRMVSAS
jgi:hypothetical protein